ncbi:unnamed protein product [Dicrocoelium dendriticum]|nr:unnamed protein product [Dicrocoelium dendriticum]
MPVTSNQVRRFYAIQKMKEISIPLPPSLATLSFEERYQIFKADLPKFNFPMSYPHWIQSEKRRHYNPTAYDSWLDLCTLTQEFESVPSITVPEEISSRKRPASPETLHKTPELAHMEPSTSRRRPASPKCPSSLTLLMTFWLHHSCLNFPKLTWTLIQLHRSN